tara:strand:- start:2422 stop:3333 length:912 start_codon:yes stop_codon:yes gene_type:complete
MIISVVIPVFNEGQGLIKNISVILSHLYKLELSFECILINDGSTDNSWEEIERLNVKYAEVKGICFSRNFGKEAAVFCGLRQACGSCVIVMDADLQHPPNLIPKMIESWQDGYKVVEATKEKRVDSWLSQKEASIFNKTLQKLTGLDLQNSSDYKLIDKIVLENMLSLNEVNTFYRALVTWTGFPVKQLFFEVNEREYGKSKFSFFDLYKLAIHGIVSFSSIPLQAITVLGIAFVIFSGILGCQTLYNYLINNAYSGFTTVILLILIHGSFIMFGMGILGIYIGKIYSEVKKRPQYIILKKIT